MRGTGSNDCVFENVFVPDGLQGRSGRELQPPGPRAGATRMRDRGKAGRASGRSGRRCGRDELGADLVASRAMLARRAYRVAARTGSLAVFAQPRCLIARFLRYWTDGADRQSLTRNLSIPHCGRGRGVSRLPRRWQQRHPGGPRVTLILVILAISITVAWLHCEYIEKFFPALRTAKSSKP